ncbi:alpha/beta hydrolase [Caldisalinibacter kiritimatiensis]|uniref:Serine aminopeptidase S33 domain-containing protein n=1 Tax=Caldisalinibacter kiritimatiensis TaxID=1304284 RepID=R1AX38_9FIRM|nr:alpha/beta fold hydrolase [Caldisalinibacter kiritimatiensis]EOD01232.1 hypothetical protein L21TH_0708 [Caldisalinibacter kiritimatiensis]
MDDFALKDEYFLEGNSIGCLLIHGFTSTPAELRELGEILYECGCTVYGIKLKGHGTTVEDLENCTYKDWIDSAVDGYYYLKEKCEQVYVIGHSMGALLAMYIAENYPVDKLGLLSPPLVTKSKVAKLAFIAKFFMKYFEWGERERTEEESKYLLGYNKFPVKSVHELNKLTKVVRKELPKINCPVIIVHSLKDETVDIKSVELLYNNVSSKQKAKVFLKESGHNITVEKEKQKVFDALLNFFTSITAKEF